VLVGNGGLNNFKQQHLGSKKCEANLKKKQKSNTSHHGSQLLTYYFTRASMPITAPAAPAKVSALIHGDITPHLNTPFPSTLGSQTHVSGDHGSDVNHGTVTPTPTPITVTSSKSRSSVDDQVDDHALKLIQTLNEAIKNLPLFMPEANNDNRLAAFAQEPPSVAADDAWEVLDPILNNFLGYGTTAEAVAIHIRCGQKGIDALRQYIEHFVIKYGIPGSLLEGKMAVLMKAMEIA
jgi:hypothetical protein